MLRGQILSSVHVWVSENTFSAFLIHSLSTQHYPGITRHVFAPLSTPMVLEWNGGTAWKEGRLPSRNCYLGGGEGRRGDGVGACCGASRRFWLTLQGERRRTENRYAGSTWPREGREGAAPKRRERRGAEQRGQPGGSCWDEQPTSGAT